MRRKMMKKILQKLTIPAALIALAVLAGCGCSNPSSGGGKGDGDGVTYTEMRLVTSVTITGNSAYYYNPTDDYLKGVFIEDRTVTLSPFLIAQYETTYDLWYTVYQWATDSTERGANVYTFANPGREGRNGTNGALPTDAAKYEPVTTISWRDAVVWCNAYSEMDNKTPVYRDGSDAILKTSTTTAADTAVMKPGANGYRLPTEAEWEYAARGGGTPSITGAFADKWAGTNNENALGTYAWYSNSVTHTVGTKAANAAGLYDMSGNVWEWCWDWYNSTVGTGLAGDPTGPTAGTKRVIRGGSWFNNAVYCAVAYRHYYGPSGRYDILGFRLAACP
jgi:formylglycine-generating enzyme required for sulfatase activity